MPNCSQADLAPPVLAYLWVPPLLFLQSLQEFLVQALGSFH